MHWNCNCVNKEKDFLLQCRQKLDKVNTLHVFQKEANIDIDYFRLFQLKHLKSLKAEGSRGEQMSLLPSQVYLQKIK